MKPANLSPEELVREVDNTPNPTPLETALGNALDEALKDTAVAARKVIRLKNELADVLAELREYE